VAELVQHSSVPTRVVKNPGTMFDGVAGESPPSGSNMTVVDDFGHLFQVLLHLCPKAKKSKCEKPISEVCMRHFSPPKKLQFLLLRGVQDPCDQLWRLFLDRCGSPEESMLPASNAKRDFIGAV
jgi:hypothetical protein